MWSHQVHVPVSWRQHFQPQHNSQSTGKLQLTKSKSIPTKCTRAVCVDLCRQRAHCFIKKKKKSEFQTVNVASLSLWVWKAWQGAEATAVLRDDSVVEHQRVICGDNGRPSRCFSSPAHLVCLWCYRRHFLQTHWLTEPLIQALMPYESCLSAFWGCNSFNISNLFNYNKKKKSIAISLYFQLYGLNKSFFYFNDLSLWTHTFTHAHTHTPGGLSNLI